MKLKIRNSISFFLASIMLFVLLPIGAYALPVNLEYGENGKIVPQNTEIRSPGSLNDGEVYTYTSASATDAAGNTLPVTDFTVGLSAIGQQYRATTTNTRSFNIVFVLDVSGSMNDNNKVQTMVQTANSALATLTDSPYNQIGIVAFSYEASTMVDLTAEPFQLSPRDEYEFFIFKHTYLDITTDATLTTHSKEVTGGTDIQSGLNVAYGMLDTAANRDSAIPVIIVLSDGVPCYYSEDYTNIPEEHDSEDGDGNANGTSSNEGIKASAYTIKQAAYLKTQMSNLQIYSIGFETATKALASATLNPTAANVALVTGDTENYATPLSGFLSGDYYYPNGAYTASNSVASLGTALTNIIVDMQMNTPIAETAEAGVLNPSSYVRFDYSLGSQFSLLGDTMLVNLGGETYVFTRHDSNYTYDVPSTSSSYNAKMEKIVLTVSDNIVIWQVPATVLACNSPEPATGETQTLAVPITLNFTIRFNESAPDLEPGVYETASSCSASFYPTLDNPYYYVSHTDSGVSTIAKNTTTTKNVTTYFKTTYPYPGKDNYYSNSKLPALTSFSVGSSPDALSYVPLSSATVTGFTDNSGKDWRDDMTVRYTEDGVARDIVFDGAAKATASVSLTTTDKTNPESYTITSFSDGYNSYTSPAAYVSRVDGDDITVSFNGGLSSVIFKDVSFTAEYSSIRAKFYGLYDDNWLINDSMRIVELNDQPVSDYPIDRYELDYYSGGYDYFDIAVSVDGIQYTFDNVEFNYKNRESYSSTVTGYGRTAISYSISNVQQKYYFTSTINTSTITIPVINYEFIYNASPETLTVRTGTNGVLSNEASYTGVNGTSIIQNGDGGYTITSLAGYTKTVTTYSVVDSTLLKDVNTSTGKNGINLLSGIVTQSLSSTGSLSILNSSAAAEDFISSATLKALNGSSVTAANSSGEAYIVLTLQADHNISNLSIALGSDAGTKFSFSMTKAVNVNDENTNILTGGTLPSELSSGTYKITFRVSYNLSDGRPNYYSANIGTVTFSLPGSTGELHLNYDSSNQNQAVRITLVTPSGH